jgi:uncharacterized protein
MMMRLLFWLALAVLVYFAIRSKVRAAQGNAPRPERRREIAAESMTRCAHCGLHFPVSEAVQADGRDYCSPAHVRLPPA